MGKENERTDRVAGVVTERDLREAIFEEQRLLLIEEKDKIVHRAHKRLRKKLNRKDL